MEKELRNTVTEKEKMSWLRLARSQNVGTKTMLRFLDVYGSLSEVLTEIKQIAKEKRSKIRLVEEKTIINELNKAKDYGAQLICPLDEEYPAQLLQIPNFPLVLTVKGDLSCFSVSSIAIVGSRSATIVGRKFAENISKELAGQGLCITSGLALGIDTSAHKGALAAEEGKTIAVLAGGIDNIYPSENSKLYNQIAETGLIISEESFGSFPSSYHFPKRNRIITGISLGVLVVEASENSGSLLTARIGLEQNRDVFAVPGHPADPKNAGNNLLLKQGAILVEKAQDILDALALSKKSSKHEVNDIEKKLSPSKPKGSIFELHEIREKVMDLIGVTPISLDEIFQELSCDPSLFQQAITQLELAGIIDRTESINNVFLMAA